MSNTIDDIMGALASARDAMDRIPQLEASLREAERQRDDSQTHAQELELKCAIYRDEIDYLTGKLRSVEAERDEYGFQTLTQADIVASLETQCNGLRNDIQSIIDKVLELKPKPKPDLMDTASYTGYYTSPYTV